MEEISKLYVGLDVHKDSITIALARPGREPAQLLAEIAHDVSRLLKSLARLGDPAQIHVVYEAGPTGYGLQRKLQAAGYYCEIIAPSLIPRRPGQRVKTDRRDSIRLAELSRAGELKPIWIPDPDDEAVRELSRAREDAVNARTRARHQLRGFLLRHDIRYAGKTAWTKTFYRWLGTLKFDAPARQIAFTEYHLAVQACDERVARLSGSLLQSITGWRFENVAKALCALRGIDVVSAVGLVAEIGDIARFDHPRKLMGYLGLVPSEHSSGDRISRGPITKSGNAHARRLLTEAAWSYRFKPRIGYQAQRRQEDLAESVRATAWKAQLRLTDRYAKLSARGVMLNKVCVAVARELAGFVWAIAKQAPASAAQSAA
jgi:transposase